MTEWAWLNGEVMPLAEARLGVEDRGSQFADGVYEVIRVYHGVPFLLGEHLARLGRSAEGILLKAPISAEELAGHVRDLVARSGVRDGIVYLHLTRGVARRDHCFPAGDCKPTLLFYVRAVAPAPEPAEGEGQKLLVVPDERWKRCWIKSIALLPNVLARQQALVEGYDEAVFCDNGLLSECSRSNLFAVIGGKLVTAPVGSKVLPGITRAVVIEDAAAMEIEVEERYIREEEARRADELFITSTSKEVSWVARLNDRYIGQGRCGPVTLRLHRALRERIRRETIRSA